MAIPAPNLADATRDVNPKISFHSLGLFYDLTPESNLAADLTYHILRSARKFPNPDGSIHSISFGSGPSRKTYTIVEKLGEGSYGAAYKATGPDGRIYAVKHIKESLDNHAMLSAFIRECMIQAIIVLYTEGLPNGPYAPRLYHMGYDPVTSEGFLCAEVLHNRFDNLIQVLTPAENNIVVPGALIQLSNILENLKDSFRFNHRDLKTDNIMYSKRGAERLFKLIDFGFSCLTWKGVKISGSWWFDREVEHGKVITRNCFKVDRDLGQLVYYLKLYETPYLSPRLNEIITKILEETAIKGKKCSIFPTLPRLFGGTGRKTCVGITGWKSSYDFFDKSDVHVPYGTPSMIKREMENFLADRPFGTGGSPPLPDVLPAVAEPPKICPPGKIYNARTRRCVKAPAIAPGADPLLAPCPPGKIRNPVTRRCIKNKGPGAVVAVVAAGLPADVAIPAIAVAPSVHAAPCPLNKVLNPATGKCVLRDGAIGKKILAAAVPVPAGGAGDAAPIKACPPGKILNPATGNCVYRDGPVGKKLVADMMAALRGAAPPAAVKVCPPHKILNPATGNCVLRDGAIGKKLAAAIA